MHTRIVVVLVLVSLATGCAGGPTACKPNFRCAWSYVECVQLPTLPQQCSTGPSGQEEVCATDAVAAEAATVAVVSDPNLHCGPYRGCGYEVTCTPE
jgi:hypothetical protein